MSALVTTITTGVTAFSATNIDELLLLTLFFSQVNATFRRQHIVVGQYLGFSLIILASLPAFFSSLIIPQDWIGILGLVPIFVGLSRLLSHESDSSATEVETAQSKSVIASFMSPETYSIAAIAFANGGDNIGIYIPLFASSDSQSLLIMLSVFFVLVGVWCYAAYQSSRQQKIADILTRYGNTMVPFVLIGLGIFILLDSGTFSNPTLTLITLIASCLCLLAMLRNYKQSSNIVES